MFFFFGIGCTKIDTTELGQDLIPAVDNIHTFDTTLNVIANNFDYDNPCDSVGRTNLHALGIIANDPYFGKSEANIYTEFKPSAFPFNFMDHDKDSLFIDSAVIVLQYSYSYGDTNALQKVQVYPLANRFKLDSIYTTCNLLDYRNILLGEKSFTPVSLRDSVHGFREKAANQLRIPVDRSLIENWIAMGTGIFQSDSAFVSRFQGFAIMADETAGGQALNYFDLSSNNTRLSIYMRSSKADKKDTSVYDFPVTNSSGRSNSIVRTRDNSEITQHLSQPAAGDSLIYLQTSPGNYAQLKIPGIATLSNRVIHRAELIMDQVYSPNTFDNFFTTPAMLYLDTKDTSATTYVPVPCDFNSTELQSGFFTIGGAGKKADNGSGQTVTRYTFNISRYVQSIITRQENNAVLRLRAPYFILNSNTYVDRCNQLISPFTYGMNNVADGRVKLNGTNSTPTKMRLRIIYSTL